MQWHLEVDPQLGTVMLEALPQPCFPSLPALIQIFTCLQLRQKDQCQIISPWPTGCRWLVISDLVATQSMTSLFLGTSVEVFLSPLFFPSHWRSLQAKSPSSAVFVCLGFLQITASGREMGCLAQNNGRLQHNQCLQRRGNEQH